MASVFNTESAIKLQLEEGGVICAQERMTGKFVVIVTVVETVFALVTQARQLSAMDAQICEGGAFLIKREVLIF